MLLQFSTSISNDAMFSSFINLRENGAESSRMDIIVSQGGVNDEGVRSVSARVVDNWL